MTRLLASLALMMTVGLTAAQGMVIQIDFNEATVAPGADWHTLDTPSVTAVELNDTTGSASGISIALDSGFQDSSSTGHSGAYNGTSWHPTSGDYFFVRSSSNGGLTTGTITLTGLNDAYTYDFAMIASASSSTYPRSADYRVNGSFGDGLSPLNGDEYDSHTDGFDNARVMSWTGMTSTSGQITITVTRTGGTSGSTAMLNAMTITEVIPEPASLVLAAGGLLLLRRQR